MASDDAEQGGEQASREGISPGEMGKMFREAVRSDDSLTEAQRQFLARVPIEDIWSTYQTGKNLTDKQQQLLEQVPDDVLDDTRLQELKQVLGGEKKEQGRGRVLTRDQIVHEAAIMTRDMYGSIRHSLDPADYLERKEEEGYYDLVDAWIITAHRLDHKFHSQFLRRASALPWTTRFHTEFPMPNYYRIARAGVDRAINEQYISPLKSHKYIYVITAKRFPPVTAPLAYYDWFNKLPGVGKGIPKPAAIQIASEMEEGEPTAEAQGKKERLAYLRNEIEQKTNSLESLNQKLHELKQQEMDARDQGDLKQADEISERMTTIAEEMDTKRDEIRELRERYNELEGELAGG